MKIPSARYRRANGFRPPIGLARSYALQLRRWLEGLQTELLPLALAAHDPHRGRLRYDARLHGIHVRLEEKIVAAAPGISHIGARVAKANASDFRRVVGVPTSELGLGNAIGRFQARNVELIKTLAESQIQEVKDLVQAADVGAWSVDDLASAIRDSFDVEASHAELIARDQVLKLNGEITSARQRSSGITRYVWTTTGDERVRGLPGGINPRGMHYALEGTVHAWDSPPIVATDGRREHPGGDYQCRCVAYPLIEDLL